MKFLVYSQEAAKVIMESWPPEEPYIWIQVRTAPSDDFHPTPTSSHCLGKLNLSFYDTTLEESPGAFTSRLAKAVVAFTNSFKETAEVCVINCEAGISRSAGLAVGLEEGLFQRNSRIRDSKPHFNVLVANHIKRITHGTLCSDS